VNLLYNERDYFKSQQSQKINTDFSKIKVGLKTLEDAILRLDGTLSKSNPRLADKKTVLEAIDSNDFVLMREISNYFFKTSGIYSRLCKYMANLYRYDWMISPVMWDTSSLNEKEKSKRTDIFYKALTFIDEFKVKKTLGDIALKVLVNGCYYGYLIPQNGKVIIQELPPSYCRSRYYVNGKPAIEFNMKFFDEKFKDTETKKRMLELFPDEFKKGYLAYKKGKLKPDFAGDTIGWYLLDTRAAIKFNINNEDYPFFMATIPAIIDLNDAQALDKKMIQQKLLKIIIQKLPLDKNSEPVFDPDESAVIHNNTVRMLGKAIGVDVLTTFADTEVEDMAKNVNATATDDLERVERTVYNESGTAQNLFNTGGQNALDKSILNDEASMYNLILQFEEFLNFLVEPFSIKKMSIKAQILPTTIYNYKDMAKLYKEQTQLGYSKMLPQISLGQSQLSILANAYFENEVLDLVNVFIPPLMSSTMNGDFLTNKNNNNNANNNTEDNQVGRPEKEDGEKSLKTLQNKESMS
jgi:hypothetical protein